MCEYGDSDRLCDDAIWFLKDQTKQLRANLDAANKEIEELKRQLTVIQTAALTGKLPHKKRRIIGKPKEEG